MSEKDEVIQIIKSLPDDASMTKLREHAEIMAGIHRGLDDIQNGRTKTQAEVEEIVRSWRAKRGSK
jgi:predicted transcriptional regulator